MNEELIRVLYDLLLNVDVREGKLEYIKEIREKAEVLDYHFENEYPEKLLETNHPSEEAWMRDYRAKRWQGPTLAATGRIYNFLQKIQQADDFKILFESDFKETGIAEELQGSPNTLEAYVTTEMPKIKNLETWLFNIFLKEYLKDANSIVAILPDMDQLIQFPEMVTTLDWLNPYPHTFESEEIIYKNEKFVIVKVNDWRDSTSKTWSQYLAITIEGVILLRQVADWTSASPIRPYPIPFEFQYLPVITTGNIIYEEEEGNIIYDSILQPCIPAWNEVLFRTDDLNILFAIHALPQKWALKLSPCKTCNGSGNTFNAKRESVSCSTCKGTGRATATPFGLLEINIDRASPVNQNPQIPPIPPAGYIERPIDSVQLFLDNILTKEFQGFKAIGLEILGQVSANQSGISKEYDRKELNTFCFAVCVHLAEVYRLSCYHILFQRYNALFASNLITDENVKKALPQITVPTDFDVLTAAMIGVMLSEAKKNQFSPVIVSGIERDYIEKLYGENSVQAVYVKILNQLDPLPFLTVDEKTVLKESQGCSLEDFVLSNNLPAFISQMMQINPKWAELPIEVKRANVEALAAEKVKQINKNLVPIVSERVIV